MASIGNSHGGGVPEDKGERMLGWDRSGYNCTFWPKKQHLVSTNSQKLFKIIFWSQTQGGVPKDKKEKMLGWDRSGCNFAQNNTMLFF